MTLQRAHVIKAAVSDPDATATRVDVAPAARAVPTASHARRVAAEILEARGEAERIIARARREADAIVASAAAAAAAEAREQEVARLAAGFLALREAEERRAERDVERSVELAVLLAERLVGEALRVEPGRIAELAVAALEEVRGARRVRIEASPDDVSALRDALGAVGRIADVQADASLERGSLVVHTELGHVDARLTPQLRRLAEALQEAMREALQ